MLLVTGAAGHLGQAVLRHLVGTYKVAPNKIVAASRDPEKLASWRSQGVATLRMDFEDEASLKDGLKGVDAALLISTDAIDRPGRRLVQHKAAVYAMAKAGIKNIVYTSMPDPEQSKMPMAADHLGTEKAIAESGIGNWTILRNYWYFENIYRALPAILASGQWYTADGGKGSGDMSRDDQARAAAQVLSSYRSGKNIFSLTGPALITKAEIAARIGGLLGRKIKVVQVSPETLIEGMVSAGVPEGMAEFFAGFELNTAAGHVAKISADYKAITGLDPASFEIWSGEHKSDLANLAGPAAHL